MTKEQLVEALHREVHFTWKHAFWVGAGLVTGMIAIASTTAVNSSKLADHQKTLDERAPAVTKLEVVASQVTGMKEDMNRRFDEQKRQLDRIEQKIEERPRR